MFSRSFKRVGLHYTAFRNTIREDSRQTAPLRGVSPRKKFAVKANVESRVNWLGSHAIEWCTGIAPADQELVKCFADGTYSVPLRAVLVLFVLFQAPLLEEPLFRGILFRGFFRSMPFLPAALLSGAIFALVHVNAASFVALWFLGIAFAWLYHRTGSILAPMTCHFLFNAVNLILVLYFPELATT